MLPALNPNSMIPPAALSRRRTLNSIAALAAIGIVISSISLQHHYSTAKSSFCDFSATVNCDIVNRSIYSQVFGVPVALIGAMGYSLLLILAVSQKRAASEWILSRARILLAVASMGLAFALYLTYVEGFILGVWCVLCLSSLFIILAVTSLSGWLVSKSRTL